MRIALLRALLRTEKARSIRTFTHRLILHKVDYVELHYHTTPAKHLLDVATLEWHCCCGVRL